MANSDRTELARAMKPPAEKRLRLVDAARALLHRQGIERTTLADVAAASGVPLGNVYYYFKTKNELVAAVVESHVAEQEAMFASFEPLGSPAERLKAFIERLAAQAESVVQSGCQMGSLCSELDKREDGLDRLGARLMGNMLAWVESQFRLMGRPDARELAVAFLSAYQGVAVLTNALRDPTLLLGESERLKRWIDTLDEASGAV